MIFSLLITKVGILLLYAVSAMLPLAKQCAFEEPSIETITGENVLSWPHVVSPPCNKISVFTAYLFLRGMNRMQKNVVTSIDEKIMGKLQQMSPTFHYFCHTTFHI